MLRITIELVPLGDERRARVIATGKITNDASGTKTSGNYNVRLFDAGGRAWRTGRIEGFPRTRLLAWDLLHRALKEIVGDRK